MLFLGHSTFELCDSTSVESPSPQHMEPKPPTGVELELLWGRADVGLFTDLWRKG